MTSTEHILNRSPYLIRRGIDTWYLAVQTMTEPIFNSKTPIFHHRALYLMKHLHIVQSRRQQSPYTIAHALYSIIEPYTWLNNPMFCSPNINRALKCDRKNIRLKVTFNSKKSYIRPKSHRFEDFIWPKALTFESYIRPKTPTFESYIRPKTPTFEIYIWPKTLTFEIYVRPKALVFEIYIRPKNPWIQPNENSTQTFDHTFDQ